MHWTGYDPVRRLIDQRSRPDTTVIGVEIPMIGTGASLNVAVAGSLVLYRLAGLL
ncbi:hypothetical protein ACWEOO_05690 [Kribbella sp. NPDC004138]